MLRKPERVHRLKSCKKSHFATVPRWSLQLYDTCCPETRFQCTLKQIHLERLAHQRVSARARATLLPSLSRRIDDPGQPRHSL